MYHVRFIQAVRSVLMAVSLFTLLVSLPAFGQASYTSQASGSITIDTPAGGGFSFVTLSGQTNQNTVQKGASNSTATASTTTSSTQVTGSTNITGNTMAPGGFATASATTDNTGFTLTNNTGAPFVVTFDWSGTISGSVTAGYFVNNRAKVSGSFELCFLPLGGQLNILTSLNNNLATPPNGSFSISSSGTSSVTLPNGGSSTLYFNLDPDGEAETTPEPYSLLLFGSGALGPLGYTLWRRRRQIA